MLEHVRGATTEQDSARTSLSVRSSDETLLSHRPWIVAMAEQLERPGVEVADLIQAGLLGVILAAKYFDPTAASFASYAAWWARAKMQSVIDMEEFVVLPPESERTWSPKLGRRVDGEDHSAPLALDWAEGPEAEELAGRSEYSAFFAGAPSMEEPYAREQDDPPDSDELGRRFLAGAAQQPADAMDHPASLELEGSGEHPQVRTGELYMRMCIRGAEDRIDPLITELPINAATRVPRRG